MYNEYDRFKVNWTEHSRGCVTTSVTGFEYQISGWKRDYLLRYNGKSFNAKVLAKINNKDGTVTMTVSRRLTK
jgi:hypothetical protein